jgi:hypothetical protein
VIGGWTRKGKHVWRTMKRYALGIRRIRARTAAEQPFELAQVYQQQCEAKPLLKTKAHIHPKDAVELLNQPRHTNIRYPNCYYLGAK